MNFKAFTVSFRNILRKIYSGPWYKKHAVWFATFVLAVILFFMAVDCNFCYLFGRSPGFADIKDPVTNEASEVYTCDSVLMGRYFNENRTPVTYKEISPILIRTLIDTEDERFYLHNGIDVDPRSVFDVQVKRLHEYKRQLMNILDVMYLYRELKEHPERPFYPVTFIFGAKAAAGYRRAKLTIKLINSVADVINNDQSIGGKIKVVFIEDYRVSNAELIFAAADISEQISTASKEASGTSNMKLMLNGALTLGTMDGANVEIVQEVGEENAFIFGLSSQEVIDHENNHDYDPTYYFNNDPDIRTTLMELINGKYSGGDMELFRELYDSLLTTKEGPADQYFILADFKSYDAARKKAIEYYQSQGDWAKSAILNMASSGKFSSDRTIQEYVRDIWKLKPIKITVDPESFE